jgi:hypothetical protein
VNPSKGKAAMLLISAKAGLLGEDVLPALKCLARISGPVNISAKTLYKLERLGVGRKDTNILDGGDVFILGGFGKKVIAVMRENQKDFVDHKPTTPEQKGGAQ